MFTRRKAELVEISDLDPEKICIKDRRTILEQQELEDFDPEVYLADFFEFELVEPKIEYKFQIGKHSL